MNDAQAEQRLAKVSERQAEIDERIRKLLLTEAAIRHLDPEIRAQQR